MKVNGELKRAQIENLPVKPLSAAEVGRMIRTPDGTNYYANGTTWDTENESFETTITADVNQTQALAYQLTCKTSVITVCAVAGDAVKLPQNFHVGLKYTVINKGAELAQIFPFLNTDINGMAVDTPIQILPNQKIIFEATVTDTSWETL